MRDVETPESAADTLPWAGVGAEEEHGHKHQKREAKLRRDAQRRPESFERFRILAQVIEERRRVVDLADHRARYAMIVIGAINAVVLVLGSRAPGIADPSQVALPWLLGILVAYALGTLLLVLAAIDCLRPREHRNVGHTGLLHWEWAVHHDIAAYQQAWSEVRMEQINKEAVLIAHLLACVIQQKYRALRWLYRGLVALIVFGGLLITMLVTLTITA